MAFLDYFTGVDSEETQRELDETDRRDKELQAKRLADGKIDQNKYDATVARIDGERINVEGEVNGAFKEGFNDGIENVKGTLGDILAFPFKLIPPIGWLLIAGAAFFYFGGGVLVLRVKEPHRHRALVIARDQAP